MASSNPLFSVEGTSGPKEGSSGNTRFASLQLKITSPDDFDAPALKVWLDGSLAWSGGSPQPGYSVLVTYDGSDVYVDMAADAGFVHETVDARVYVASGTTSEDATVTYSFLCAIGNVTNLQAKSWCDGKRIDLSWTNPADVTQVKIRRSTIGYPRFVDDPGEDVYSGAPITAFVDGVYVGTLQTTNNALEENKFYYYTVFISVSASPYVWLHHLKAEVQGLSIKDYYAAEGDYVYALLPKEVRKADADPQRGPNRYLMRDYCRGTIQCGVNLYRGWIEALLHFRDPDLMPAGRIGDTENNYGILSAQNWDYGLPAGPSLDATALRRLALGLVDLYQNKGHCPNLVTLAKTVATWDAICDDIIEPNCGINRLATTWLNIPVEDEHFITNYFAELITPGVADPTVLFVNGQVTLQTNRLHQWDNSLNPAALSPADYRPPTFVIDKLGTYACIKHAEDYSGPTQVIEFTDYAAKLRKEIVGTGTGGVNAFSIGTIDVTSYPWQFPDHLGFDAPTFGTDAFVGLKLMDSTGAVFPIVASLASPTNLLGVTGGNPASGAFSIAADFDPAGVTYATRIPIFGATFYSGEFSLTYHPIWDIRLRDDLQVGPWSLISSFTSPLSSAWAPTPTDVVLIAIDVHKDTGIATTVTNGSLEDVGKLWTEDEWVGHYLLPDWNQTKLFRIVGNSPTELFVTVPPGTGGVDTVSKGTTSGPFVAGSHYVILDKKDAIRYSNLVSLLPSFIPDDMRAYIKFDRSHGVNVEDQYMELAINANIKTTTSGSPSYEVIAAREFDLSILPPDPKHFFFVATLASNNVGVISHVELWDVTHNVLVSGTSLSNAAAPDVMQPETYVSSELVPSNINGSFRLDAPTEYELRLYRTGGVVSDLAGCFNAYIRVVYET